MVCGIDVMKNQNPFIHCQNLLLLSLIMFVASLGANTEELRIWQRFLGDIFLIMNSISYGAITIANSLDKEQ